MPDPEKESLWGYRFLGSSSGGAMSPEEQERVRRNFPVVVLVVLCLFALLFLRLWYLQLVQGEDLQQRSEQNHLRQQDLPPWRGKILDHNGGVLYGQYAEMAVRWFAGHNLSGASLIDASSGGCCDALTASGPHSNQGAAAVIAYLLAEAARAVRAVMHA